MADNFIAGLQQALVADTGQGFVDTQIPTPELPNSTPAATPTPSTEPTVERKLTDPPVKGKARQHFKALEESKRAVEATAQQQQQEWAKERETLTQQLAELRKQAPHDTEELQRLREEVAALDITRDPGFSAKFEKPKEIAIGRAANLAGARAADVKAVLALEPGTLRDQRLQEILGELPPSVAAVVKAANDKVLALEFERGVEIETAKATWQTKAQQKEAARQAERAKREQALPSLVDQWRGTVDMLDPAKYPKATQIVADATRFFKGEGLNPSEQAAVALQSAMFIPLSEEYDRAQTEIESLKSRLARYERSMPTGDGQGDAQTVPQARTPDERIKGFQRGLDKALWNDPTFSGARR